MPVPHTGTRPSHLSKSEISPGQPPVTCELVNGVKERRAVEGGSRYRTGTRTMQRLRSGFGASEETNKGQCDVNVRLLFLQLRCHRQRLQYLLECTAGSSGARIVCHCRRRLNSNYAYLSLQTECGQLGD